MGAFLNQFRYVLLLYPGRAFRWWVLVTLTVVYPVKRGCKRFYSVYGIG